MFTQQEEQVISVLPGQIGLWLTNKTKTQLPRLVLGSLAYHFF